MIMTLMVLLMIMLMRLMDRPSLLMLTPAVFSVWKWEGMKLVRAMMVMRN